MDHASEWCTIVSHFSNVRQTYRLCYVHGSWWNGQLASLNVDHVQLVQLPCLGVHRGALATRHEYLGGLGARRRRHPHLLGELYGNDLWIVLWHLHDHTVSSLHLFDLDVDGRDWRCKCHTFLRPSHSIKQRPLGHWAVQCAHDNQLRVGQWRRLYQSLYRSNAQHQLHLLSDYQPL